jgi:hypothetical protein
MDVSGVVKQSSKDSKVSSSLLTAAGFTCDMEAISAVVFS